MNAVAWTVVGALAVATFAARLAGLLGGAALLRNPRARRLLEDLPGCLLVGLVGASLAEGEAAEWLAAGVALLAAGRGGVLGAMAAGLLALAGLRALGL